VAIIAVLVALAPQFSEEDQIYAYAIGVLVGTAIQLAIPAWDLRNTNFKGEGRFRMSGSSPSAPTCDAECR
jgi:peptidoglycan biosynthesis protein MviN/MurJ (putative lipid II flippase)